jgi:hypothetical protein
MMPAMSTPPSPPGSPASSQAVLLPTTIEANEVQPHRGPPRDHRRRIGRPTKLTPRLAKALVKLIAQTGRIEPAVRRCGVPPSTVTDWIARGQGRHMTRGANRRYAEFAGAVEKALGQYECDQLAGIQAAAAAKPENWTARAWSLERWDPQRYGRRTAVDVSGRITMQLDALLVGVVRLVERYVPVDRRKAELADIAALAGAAAGADAPLSAPQRAR